jgi:hypothetical protein
MTVAKICEELQKPCFEKWIYASFKNHDVESAWFLYYMGSELGYIPIDIRFEDIVTAIILGPSQIYDYTIKAKSIGVNKLSDLEPGYSVDFVILDENLNVAKTIVNGRVAYD